MFPGASEELCCVQRLIPWGACSEQSANRKPSLGGGHSQTSKHGYINLPQKFLEPVFHGETHGIEKLELGRNASPPPLPGSAVPAEWPCSPDPAQPAAGPRQKQEEIFGSDVLKARRLSPGSPGSPGTGNGTDGLSGRVAAFGRPPPPGSCFCVQAGPGQTHT